MQCIFTQAKLLSTQLEIEFEYTFMPYLLYNIILRIYSFLQKHNFCVENSLAWVIGVTYLFKIGTLQ